MVIRRRDVALDTGKLEIGLSQGVSWVKPLAGRTGSLPAISDMLGCTMASPLKRLVLL